MATGTLVRTELAVIYGRNSSAKQKSIDEQQAENLAACRDHDWTVAAELSDPVSASRYATKLRANWQLLLDMLPTIHVVVLWEPSRGDRALATWAAFLDACRDHGVLIHAVAHRRTYDPRNPRDYRSLAEDGVDSAYESDKISMRVLRSRRASAEAGRPIGRTPLGYVRRYDPVTRAFAGQREQPDEAAFVRSLFDAVASGEPLSRIVQRLTRQGVPTVRTAPVWTQTTVKGIVTNAAYRPHPDDPSRGCLVHRGQTYPGQWAPLVDEETWQRVRRALALDEPDQARQARRANAPGAVKHLLSGSHDLMTAPCGAKLAGWVGRTGARGASYACESCRCVSAPMWACDEYVTRLVVARLSAPDARYLWAADTAVSKKAGVELRKLERQLAEALELYVADQMSAKAYSAKEAALTPRIEAARRRSQPAGTPLGALKVMEAAKVAAEMARPAWDALPLPARREVIASIFTSLVLGPKTIRITRHHLPEERLAIVAERISHEWRKPACAS